MMKNTIILVFIFLSIPVFADPLVQESDLTYVGAFRVPKGNLGGESIQSDTLGYSQGGIAYNKINDSLFLYGHPYELMVTELSIPTLINSANINDLNTATVLQAPVDPSGGNRTNLTIAGTPVSGSVNSGGLLVDNNRLISTTFVFYDASNEGHRSHLSSSIDWTTDIGFTGMFRVGTNISGDVNIANGGWVGGYMCSIPLNWQSSLGGTAFTGQGGLSVISRTSLGPCLWVFTPSDLGATDPTPSTMLVGYSINNPTLGTYEGTSLYFNSVSEMNGAVFPVGTDSVLIFGRHGLGPTGLGDTCYGTGTDNESLHGTPVGDGSIYCYDPTSAAKGDHGYPYVYRIWAYNANDLLKVKNSTINPATSQPYQYYEITPYSIWDLTFPHAIDGARLTGAAYDESTQRIFITQDAGDIAGEPYPLIQVFSLNTTTPTVNAGTDQNVSVSEASINGTYTIESGRTISSCTWSNDRGGSGTLTASSGTISGTVTGLSEGVNVITVTLTDSESEQGTDTVNITYNPMTGRKSVSGCSFSGGQMG